jgi:hypothetical protein
MNISRSVANSRFLMRLAFASTLLLLAACGGATDETVLDRGGSDAPALSLDISASEITEGGSVTLTWASHLASSCVAGGDWSGNKGISGREVIDNITVDSQFTISCNSPEGQISDYATVRVVEQPQSPVLDFTASATQIMQGDSLVLQWTALNADSCTASGDWFGSLATSGSEQIDNLQQDSLFILECSGSGGSVRQTVTVDVQPPEPVAPSLNFSISQSSVAYGGSVTLSWSSSEADSCVASGGWSGSKSLTGNQVIDNLTADSSFSLECSGAGGTVSRQVSVTVSAQQGNGTATLSWTPPTENTDNSALTDLAGFKIYYGTAPGSYSETIDVPSAGITSHVVENLGAGTWYFIVTAYNSLGIESAPSDEVSKTIN